VRVETPEARVGVPLRHQNRRAAVAAGTGGDEAELARRAVIRTRELVEAVGIPTTLQGFGVKADDLPALVRNGLNVTRLTKAFPIRGPHGAEARIVDDAEIDRLSGETAG